jgi:hypothetical protein
MGREAPMVITPSALLRLLSQLERSLRRRWVRERGSRR